MGDDMYQKILEFWFEEIDQSQWWLKNEEFDQMIIDRFSSIHAQAIRCELFEWRTTPEGRLAEVIVIDQFSRNMFRDSAESFKYDALALILSQEAVLTGSDQALNATQRSVLYLPFMHSESSRIHEISLTLHQQNGIQSSLDFEIKHKNIIDRFGRYPHRNKILGRPSTEQELEFLKLPGSGF
ncbi:MAG: DUF924 domain-containing protein [Pseudomonadales bacterium]|nr:DUF924 domain-containing protein [Pseudomonadales bacterium]